MLLLSIHAEVVHTRIHGIPDVVNPRDVRAGDVNFLGNVGRLCVHHPRTYNGHPPEPENGGNLFSPGTYGHSRFSSTEGRLGKGWRSSKMEPMTGIEPAYSAWEADVLPLNYIGAVAWEG